MWDILDRDSLLAEYVEWGYDRDRQGCRAMRWAMSQWPKSIRRTWPLTAANIDGWKKREPPFSRPPTPIEVAYAMAV